MGHKHPKSPSRIARDVANMERNKANRKAKWERMRRKWAMDVAYQKKQERRLEWLKNHPGYEKNLEEGKLQKERIKQEKEEKRKRLAALKKLKRRNNARF